MWNRNLQRYYDLVAQHYRDELEIIFEQLATGLLNLADLEAGESAIDLGAGTGVVSRLALTHTSRVVSVDFSLDMLKSCLHWGSANAVQCDIHRLGFRENSFDVALASFAFSATELNQTIAEVKRVLIPGGRLIVQEWGPEDQLSQLIFETLAEYAVPDPSLELNQLRRMVSAPIPWDEIDSLDDIKQIIEASGLEIEFFEVVTVPILFSNCLEFLRSKLAWPSRRMELEEMPVEARNIFFSELLEHLLEFTNPDRTLTWRPEVIRIKAYNRN